MADATVTSLGEGVYRVTEGSRARLAYAAGPSDARWVFLDGRVYVIEGSPEGLPHHAQPSGVAQPVKAAKRRSFRDEGTLTAPMPATVIGIIVEPGQRVSAGDVLIMLEAMKMELPIRSPRDGAVKTISCRPGELVQPGVPLLELE